MANKPGYVKLMYGKKLHIPRDSVLCHGKRISRSVILVRQMVDRRFHRNRDVPRAIAFVSPVECPDVSRTRHAHFTPHRKRSSVYTVFGRYRENNPNLERVGDIPAGTKLGVWKIFSNNQISSSQNLNSTGTSNGSITSERCWDNINPGPPYRFSGPFALIKTSIPGNSRFGAGTIKSTLFSPGNWWQYDGDFICDSDWISDSIGNYLATSAPAIVGYDTLAWDKLKPRVSKASAAQFFYELRDLPGQLMTSAHDFSRVWTSISKSTSDSRASISAIMNPKDSANSFLNHNFGWVPFLSDVANMYNAYQRSAEYISELVRTNDTWVRKRCVLKSETVQRPIGRRYSAGIEPFGFQIQGLCDDMVVDGITCKAYFDVTEVVETKVWATGYFKFYRPEYDMNLDYNDSYFGALQRLLTLYGVRINPTLIYKVTPWTWAIDWFSGFGKYIERLDDFVVDGIVSKQLCIMASTKRYVQKTCIVNFSSGRRTFQFRREFSSKVRKIADSPYGFDQTWNNLSIRQWAILGAIGISRSNTGFISRGA